VRQEAEKAEQPIVSAVQSQGDRHFRVHVPRHQSLWNESADIHLGGSPAFKHHPYEIIRCLLVRDNRTQRVELLLQLRNPNQVLPPLLFENLVLLVFCLEAVYLFLQAVQLRLEWKDIDLENCACENRRDQKKDPNLNRHRKIIELLGHDNYTLRLLTWPARGSRRARPRTSLPRGGCRRGRLVTTVHVEFVV